MKAFHYKWRLIGLSSSMQETKIHVIHHLVSQYQQNEGYEFFHDHFIVDDHREGNDELRIKRNVQNTRKKKKSR